MSKLSLCAKRKLIMANKSIFLCFLLTYFFLSNTANPCTVIKRQSIEKGIADAQLIVIGKVERRKEGNKEVKFLRVLKKWTPALDEIKLKEPAAGGCDTPAVLEGKVYLFVNAFPVRNSSENIEGISESSSYYIRISSADLYMNKLAEMKLANMQINPAYEYCLYDNECISVSSTCNTTDNINIKFQASYLNFLKEKNDGKTCDITNVKTEAVCINFFCAGK